MTDGFTGELQALVTGAILGSLMRAPESGLLIDVEPVMDGENYTGQIKVRGQESGEELLVVVMAEAKEWSLKTRPSLEVVPDE